MLIEIPQQWFVMHYSENKLAAVALIVPVYRFSDFSQDNAY